MEGGTRLTGRGWLAVGMTLFSVIAMVNSGQRPLLALFATCSTALVVSWVMHRGLLGRLVCARTVPGHVVSGDAIMVRMDLRNRGGRMSQFLVSDTADLPEGSRRSVIEVERLEAQSEREIEYRITTGRRGVCRFTNTTIISESPFGLIGFSKQVPAPGTTLILPFPGRAEGWLPPGGRRFSGIGLEVPERSGTAHEYFGARDYRPEDPMRSIHWKLTARAGKPIVREFLTTAAGEAEVVLDLASRDYIGEAAGLFEPAVSLTATLLGEMARGGIFSRLWLAGRETVGTHLACGEEHLVDALKALALVLPDGPDEYSDTLARLASGFAPRAAVVCVLPHLAIPGITPALSGLTGEGHPPQLMVVHPKTPMSRTITMSAVSRTGVPGWCFGADQDFRAIDMRGNAVVRAAGGTP
jgi:uncharacterized protein (DUF58 family)